MVKLSSVAEILNGDRSSNYPSGKDFVAFGIPFINAGHLTKGKIDFSNMDYISEQKYQQLSGAKIRKHDILLCLRGSLGKYAVSEIDAGAPASSIAVIRPNKSLIDAGYLTCIISSFVFQRQIDLENNGSSQPNLSASSVSSFTIPLPPVNEQQRIAEALSDADSMISSLEKLITKKKAVKQGAMQELSTGKKRLPGFDGDIKYKSLASLCTVIADGDWIESKDQSNDGIRLIQTGNIGVGKYLDKTDKQRFISKDTFDRLKCLEIFENDVIVSRLPEPAGRACILPYSNKRRITAVDCTIIRFADYNPILFVAYSQTKQYQDKVDMAMAGSTRQRISRKELGEIPIPVFPTIEEQNVLASIFSDMDNEIEALEQKLTKARQIKQGMMQQLLTGRIRLV